MSKMDKVMVNREQLLATRPKLWKYSMPVFRTAAAHNIGENTKDAERESLLQFAVRLAWALTCHKVQGQTFCIGQRIGITFGKANPVCCGLCES